MQNIKNLTASFVAVVLLVLLTVAKVSWTIIKGLGKAVKLGFDVYVGICKKVIVPLFFKTRKKQAKVGNAIIVSVLFTTFSFVGMVVFKFYYVSSISQIAFLGCAALFITALALGLIFTPIQVALIQLHNEQKAYYTPQRKQYSRNASQQLTPATKKQDADTQSDSFTFYTTSKK